MAVASTMQSYLSGENIFFENLAVVDAGQMLT